MYTAVIQCRAAEKPLPSADAMANQSGSCGRPELATAVSTSLIWLASLFTFSFAQTAAGCSNSHGITFPVAVTALAVGSIAAGIMGDRLGRSATARLLFLLGTLACIASAATHPDDSTLIIVFAAAAAISAGGTHVSAELLLEQVPERYRALVLLSYPALFFPVGAVQYMFEQIGWAASASVTAFFVVTGGVALFQLPESRLFLLSPRDTGQPSRASREDSVPPWYSVGDDMRRHPSDLEYSAVRHRRVRSICCRCLATPVQGMDGEEVGRVKDGLCSRLMLVTTSLWLFFTAAYYLTSLTFLLPTVTSEGSPYVLSTMCSSAREGQAGRTATPGAGSSASQQCSALPTFHSGAHLMGAEMVAVLLTAVIANTASLGRRLTLAVAFACAAFACAVTAAALPAFGCSGTAARAALEFFVRASLAGCAQGLFLYTLEVCATSVRSTVIGVCVGVFRLGGLLTLANNLAPGSDSRLQWSVYALQQTWSLLSGGGGEGHATSSSNMRASTAVLVVSANFCLLSACLALCLPVEPRSKMLRDVLGSPFTDSQVADDSASPLGQGGREGGQNACTRALARALGGILRAASVEGGGGVAGGYGRVPGTEMDLQPQQEVGDDRAPEGGAGGQPMGAHRQNSLFAGGIFGVGRRSGGGSGYAAVPTEQSRNRSVPPLPAPVPSRSDEDFDLDSDLDEKENRHTSGAGLQHEDTHAQVDVEPAACIADTLHRYHMRALRRYPRPVPEQTLATSTDDDSASGPAPPSPYAALPLSSVIQRATAAMDVGAATWLVDALTTLAAVCRREGHQDTMDAELAGLDTAGLDALGLAQEATRFRLLVRMWASRPTEY